LATLSLWLFGSAVLSAQTRVDLSSQVRNVDFTQAAATKPSKAGLSLPPGCTPGETFLKLNGAPGQNLYVCVANDTWLGQGIAPSSGPGIVIAGNSVSVDESLIPAYSVGAGAPALGCLAGRDVYLDETNRDYYFCGADNVWERLAKPGQSGGSGQISWQKSGTAVAVSASGVDYPVFSTAGLTLEAGACLRVAVGWQHSSGTVPLTPKLKIGSTAILTRASTASTALFGAEYLVCNDPGSQSAQTTVQLYEHAGTTDGGPASATSSVDLSGAFTLSFAVSAGSAPSGDQVTPRWWRITK
jgi:hypothetical protein